MKKFIATSLFVLCLCGALPAQAQDEEHVPEAQKQTGRSQTLEPVVVVAGRIEEQAKNVVQFVTVIPQEEIQKSQYEDLGGLLRNYGVQIDGYGPNQQAQATLRGARASFPSDPGAQGSVLILMDGRRTGSNNINMIPMVNIERVEILRGPAAVQYGTSAIGGVINVIAKRGAEQPTASAQGGMGSWGSYRGQAGMAWALGPVDFSGGVSRMSAGDYYTGGHHPQKYHNTGMDGKTAYSLNTGLNFLEEHRIGVALHGVQTEHAGSPGAFYDIDRKTFLDMASSSCDLLYDGGYKDLGFSWKGRFFFGKDEHANDFKHPADMNAWGDPRQFYFHALNDYQGAQGQLSVKKSVLTLTGGVDWLSSDTDKKGSSYVYNEKYAYGNLGVFALAKIALFDDRLIVSGGVRNETYRMETSGNNLERKKKSDKLDKTVPSFGVAFHVAEWLTMKGNYGEAYRIPNGLELMGFQGSVYPTLPNPDLKPEEARSYDAGFEIRHKSLQIGLSYFETEYKKKIITMYTPPTWEAQSVNADGKIWMKGFEGNAGYDLGEAFGRPFKLRPYVNFTALTECWAASGENSSYSSVYKNKVPLVNDLEMGYGVQFAHPEVGFEADLRLTYVGYHYEQDWNETSPTYGQVVREGGKTIADLFLRQKIYSTDKAGTLSVYGEVRNILNERHALIKDYPMPGRSVFIGLRYDY